MKTHLFQSCGHCWLFQICGHIECSTFTASSFRIWNSWAGIPSPPLALFTVMLPKAHSTSHSRMSGSRWAIIPSWLSQSWTSFLYSSSVYSCHLSFISSASVRSLLFLAFPVPILACNSPLISPIFLNIYLVFPILLWAIFFQAVFLEMFLLKKGAERSNMLKMLIYRVFFSERETRWTFISRHIWLQGSCFEKYPINTHWDSTTVCPLFGEQNWDPTVLGPNKAGTIMHLALGADFSWYLPKSFTVTLRTVKYNSLQNSPLCSYGLVTIT